MQPGIDLNQPLSTACCPLLDQNFYSFLQEASLLLFIPSYIYFTAAQWNMQSYLHPATVDSALSWLLISKITLCYLHRHVFNFYLALLLFRLSHIKLPVSQVKRLSISNFINFDLFMSLTYFCILVFETNMQRRQSTKYTHTSLDMLLIRKCPWSQMYATVSIPSIVCWTVRAEQVSQLFFVHQHLLRSAIHRP